MKAKTLGWDAMFGIKEIYHRDPEEMTDEEYKMAYAAHQDMIDSLFRRGHNE